MLSEHDEIQYTLHVLRAALDDFYPLSRRQFAQVLKRIARVAWNNPTTL